MKNKIFYIQLIALLTYLSIPFIGEAREKEPQFVVVIDAGHGGKDIGASDNGAREKDINLGVALELEKLLKKKMKDAKVVMTRDDDTYLTLQQRADIANKAKGNLFISIHTNSVDKSNKNRRNIAGSSVYALGLHKDDNNMKVARRENSVIELESNYEQKYSGFDPSKDESYIIFEMAQKKNLSKSIRFAEDVEKELVGIGRKNRGVHQAGFWVLWATSMPSVLIELDFICNPTCARYMTSSKGSKEFAEAIYKAVAKYKTSWAKSVGNHGSKQGSISSAEMEEEPAYETSYGVTDTDGFAARLTPSSRKEKTDRPEKRMPKVTFVTPERRRRNSIGRQQSASRDVETASIPLHTDSERIPSMVSLASTEEVKAEQQSQTDDKSDKKSKKKGKKQKKPKEKKEKSKRNPNAHNAKTDKFVKVYKIQILASADLLRQNNARFCGLKPISTYKENNLYKYYYGESTEKSEIETMLKEVQEKIPDAFIVTAVKSMDTAKQ